MVDGPISYHRLWRGLLMETTESDRGAVVAGLAAAPMRCMAASSDGASASSLFEDPEGMLAVATMIPGIDIVRLQAEVARLEARASHVCTLRDFRTGQGGRRALSWADEVEAEGASRGVVRPRGVGGVAFLELGFCFGLGCWSADIEAEAWWAVARRGEGGGCCTTGRRATPCPGGCGWGRVDGSGRPPWV